MNTKEIQKLRRKFILIAMLSFLLVMVFIGLLINRAIPALKFSLELVKSFVVSAW